MYSLQKVRSWTRSLFTPPDLAPRPYNPEAGAHVPVELFDRILFYVSIDDRRREVRAHAEAEARRTNTPIDDWDLLVKLIEASPSYGLKSCSLVCSYWANQCRRYLFTDRLITIRTLEEATTFARYATQKPSQLLPISAYIKGINVVYMYSNFSSRSFLDILHVPPMRNKLLDLTLRGPFPGILLPSKLDTPHWSVTNVAALPPTVTAYRNVALSFMNFPSLRHAIKYIKHFKYTTTLSLTSLTWDGKSLVPLSYMKQSSHCQRQKIEVFVESCTNDVFLGWQVAMMYSDFPLRMVEERDQHWAFDIMRRVHSFYHDSHALADESASLSLGLKGYSSELTGYQPLVIMRFLYYPGATSDLSSSTIEIHLTCDIKPLTPPPFRTGRTSPRPIRIMAVMVYVSNTTVKEDGHTKLAFDFSEFRTAVERHCIIYVVVFAFEDLSVLKAVVQDHPTLTEPLAGHRLYRLAYKRNNPAPLIPPEGYAYHTWVFIDPITMEPTGEVTERLDRILPMFERS